MKIGYLGPSGTHSQAAADTFIGECLHCGPDTSWVQVPMMTLTHILDAVEEGGLELGVVPVENALEGSVAEVLDGLALRLRATRIVAEFVRPVQHALIRRYEFMEGITCVHSHPQAIGQCREALYALLGRDVHFVPASSTSEAVRALLNLDESHAALGTVQAARHYGLEVLVENIGNLSQNATRFLVVAARQMPEGWLTCLKGNGGPGGCSQPWKTSICVGLDENRPGALLAILTTLARLELNLSKIESRPTKKCLGEYVFYLDVEGRISPEAEAAIRSQTSFYRNLGEYPILGVLADTPPAAGDQTAPVLED